MSKTAVVINPWVTDFKLYDEWMHPIGLYFLISLLKFNGWDVHYINCLERGENSKPKRYSTGDFPSKVIPRPQLYKNIYRKYKQYGISEELFINKLQNVLKPDVIFVGSSMTYWIEGLVSTVNKAKEIFPAVPIIIGGTSVTLIPEIIKRKLPDVEIFSGPLSESFVEFINQKKIPGKLSLNKWEPTLVDAFQMMAHHHHGPVFTSFGCPFHCSYCASPYLNNTFQTRPQNTIINEMNYLINKSGVTDFAFYDDALLYQPEKNFMPLAEKISRLNNNIRMHTPNGLHIRWIDKRILDAMKKCGFVTLRFGYESGDIKYQKETSAKISREQLAQKINLIKSAGFKSKDIGIYTMGGLPNQKVEDLIEELSFVSSLEVKVKPVFLSPVPHTPLFEYYTENFPQLRHNPLFHNDLFFITQLPGWDYSVLEEIKSKAREFNKDNYFFSIIHLQIDNRSNTRHTLWLMVQYERIFFKKRQL